MYNQKMQEWLEFDEQTKNELMSLENDEEIEDRFYKDLEFGTGGLRGLMGAGTNRVNSYTIRKTSLGLANYLTQNFTHPIIVIAYDTRNHSRQFAEDAATVFSSQGIKTYIFDSSVPTPTLSFAVRALGASAGIVITASHNPKEYNGYKVYDHNGGQLTPANAKKVITKVNKVQDLKALNNLRRNEVKVEYVGEELLSEFIKNVQKQSLYKETPLKVVYTPLHGAGNIPVRRVLEAFEVSMVEDQELPNGDFPTVKSPNPEDKAALSLAIEKAKEIDADVVLGTDPDCDRVGAAVKHQGEYVLLTGNQIGALLVDFVLSFKDINNKSTLIKTIVTNELGAEIARAKGLTILQTLTGFKYIGEKINEFESQENREFVIGYEESYGYLVGTHARDKDGVVSSMLICEMASYYKSKNLTLLDRLDELYKTYGYYLDDLDSITLTGIQGIEKIQSVMTGARFLGISISPNVKEVKDYSLGIDGLPMENVLKYVLNDDSWVAIRPSGTEPKIKFYYSIKGENQQASRSRLKGIKANIENQLDIVLM